MVASFWFLLWSLTAAASWINFLVLRSMTIGPEEKDQGEDELHHHWTDAESRQQQLGYRMGVGEGDGGVSEAITKNAETYEGWEDVQSDPFRRQDTAGSHHVPAHQSYKTSSAVLSS